MFDELSSANAQATKKGVELYIEVEVGLAQLAVDIPQGAVKGRSAPTAIRSSSWASYLLNGDAPRFRMDSRGCAPKVGPLVLRRIAPR